MCIWDDVHCKRSEMPIDVCMTSKFTHLTHMHNLPNILNNATERLIE